MTVFLRFNFSNEERSLIIDHTGIPPTWNRLIDGYDMAPNIDHELSQEETININELFDGEILSIHKDELLVIKERLHQLFVLGPSAFPKNNIDLDFDENDSTDDDGNDNGIGTYPIPPETFLESISRQVGVHPLSVYWLVKEGIEQEGWHCWPEEKRLVEDIFTVLILRSLGHRWPKQLNDGEKIPDWADADGIIPLINAFGERSLVERVRTSIPEDFPEELVTSIEYKFEAIVGEVLENWLSNSFYKRHISQFKKRPIAWQLQSQPFNKRNLPAFSCLIYYHKLDIDVLPKLRSQYVGPLRQRYETELRTLSNLALLTADQSERKLQLETWIDELKDFEARLEEVESEGFASPLLAKIAKKEPLDRWTSRDGQAPPPQDVHAFELQEKRYDPDLNDGVRVNIAPLQKAGLLAADVLNAKDLDKAIADRAEWRADERRWCREGKLPKPGGGNSIQYSNLIGG